MPDRTTGRWLCGVAGAALAVLAVKLLFTPTIMLLDEKTLEKFQEASSRNTSLMQSENTGLSHYEITAISFQKAVKEIGYHPEKTILYWLSSEFKSEVVAGDSAKVTDTLRLTDSLLGAALGDGSSEEEFGRIIGRYSPEVQSAARQRRGG